MKWKLIMTVLVVLLAMWAIHVVGLAVFPVMSMDQGVRQLEDSNEVFQEVQLFEWIKTVFSYLVYSIAGLIIVLVWRKSIAVLLKGK